MEVPQNSWPLIGLVLVLAVSIGCHSDQNRVRTAAPADLHSTVPPWAGSKVGRSDRVLHPWTPVVADSHTISCWGREHRWSGLPFPEQITSQGRQLLSRPIDVSVSVAGRSLSWRPDGEAGRAQRTSDHGTAARIHRSTTAGPLTLSGHATVEYDGMVRIDFEITPAKRVEVEHLAIEIPVKAEYATLYHYWPLDGRRGERTPANSGGMKPITSHFRPLWWLGNEDGGLAWFAESDQHWTPVASDKCIEVIPGPDEVVLRLRVWDRPIAIDRPKRFTMGLMATPVRPWPKDWHQQHITGSVFYGNDMAWLDEVARVGATILQWGNEWSGIHAHSAPLRPDDFLRINREIHRRGMRVVPYFGFEISDAHPHYDRYHQEVRVAPFYHRFPISPTENPWYLEYMPPQTSYAVCYRSHWADYLVEGMANMKRDYEIDGVYMDATTSPWECSNSAHGCGYIAGNGAIRPTFPIFSVRDTIRRIRTIFPEESGGVMLAHNSTCMMIPTLSFVTCTMNGESYVSEVRPKNILELMSLEVYRAEYMAHNWGVPHMMLSIGDPITEQESLAVGLLHDVVVRDDLGPASRAHIAQYKRVFREFRVDEAEWFPYWRNEHLITLSHPQQMKVSFYRDARNEVLLVVSNLGNEGLDDAWVAFEKSDTFSRPLSWAANAISAEAVPVTDGRVNLRLPTFDPRLIKARF